MQRALAAALCSCLVLAALRADAAPSSGETPHVHGCLATGNGFLRAKIRGAMNLDINWHNSEIECDGGSRPNGSGLRVSFAGPLHSDGRRLRLVFGVGTATEGNPGRALPTNLTVIFEGEQRLFATRGEDKCTVDNLTQERFGDLSGKVRTYRVIARGFCISPASTLDDREHILLSTFDFAGRLTFGDEDVGPSVVSNEREVNMSDDRRAHSGTGFFTGLRRRGSRMAGITKPPAPAPARARGALVAIAAVFAAAFLANAFGQSAQLEDLAAFPKATLTIRHRGPTPAAHEFDVWVANSSDRQEQGLMFVRDLPAGHGMIFPEDPPRTMNMWMKNTYIELDMVFISAAGRISKIIPRAHPLSETTLSSDDPVAAVLEIGGGESARLGLSVGDRVSWQMSK